MKMTVYQVMTALDAIRKDCTARPAPGEIATRGIDQLVEADNRLIDLQDRLMKDYGDGPQDGVFEEDAGDPGTRALAAGLKTWASGTARCSVCLQPFGLCEHTKG